MTGLGRPVVLNSGGGWKCVDSFVVGGEKQWVGWGGGSVAFRGGARNVELPMMLWIVSPKIPTVLLLKRTGIVDVYVSSRL